jgi:hypothetical protein
MSDDLVQRLRNNAVHHPSHDGRGHYTGSVAHLGTLLTEAADRIEALEAELRLGAEQEPIGPPCPGGKIMSAIGIPATEQMALEAALRKRRRALEEVVSNDLVKRLRAWEAWELGDGVPPPPTNFGEAADRIEELERRDSQLLESTGRMAKRIEALEKERQIWEAAAVDGGNRVTELEAALREIAAIDTNQSQLAGVAKIARRALAGK